MPIYEYRCKKGHTFEVRQSFTDDPVTVCDVHGEPVQRVFRPPAVHFKGSGFYNTDYGTRKRSREMKEAKDGAKSESSSSENGKSETNSKSESSDAKPAKSESASKKADSSSAKSS
jgi:putative FmdB family regulatory protein